MWYEYCYVVMRFKLGDNFVDSPCTMVWRNIYLHYHSRFAQFCSVVLVFIMPLVPSQKMTLSDYLAQNIKATLTHQPIGHCDTQIIFVDVVPIYGCIAYVA